MRLWNWLPAFRAVAETEHIHRAAKILHLSPSALSRAIHLIEEDIGHPLFNRVGRKIVLNPAGQKILESVRDAMRILDDGVTTVTSSVVGGPVHIACTDYLAITFVIPALHMLQERSPQLQPYLRLDGMEEANSLLLRGELDVAFIFHPKPHKLLRFQPLGEITNGVYCGPGHPLYTNQNPTLEDLLQHNFVAPHPNESEDLFDHWPAEIQRRVSIYLPEIHLAMELCAHGGLLSVLPDRLPTQGTKLLRRLPFDFISPIRVFAVSRIQAGKIDLVDPVISAVWDQIRAPSRAE